MQQVNNLHLQNCVTVLTLTMGVQPAGPEYGTCD